VFLLEVVDDFLFFLDLHLVGERLFVLLPPALSSQRKIVASPINLLWMVGVFGSGHPLLSVIAAPSPSICRLIVQYLTFLLDLPGFYHLRVFLEELLLQRRVLFQITLV